ncbi:MAG: replicative helicase loader/inhibitor [Halanaerobium sp.]
MQKSECIKLLSYLNNCYNNRFVFPKPNDKPATDLMVEVWFDLLKYYQYQLVVAALKKLIINKPEWPPTPGEIVREAEKLMLPEAAKISAGEAWHLALEAVHKYGYYNSKKGMESLPPAVREAVRNFGGFAALCHSQDTSFVKNQFIKLYQEVELKRKDTAYLPKPFKKKLLLISKEKEVE